MQEILCLARKLISVNYQINHGYEMEKNIFM